MKVLAKKAWIVVNTKTGEALVHTTVETKRECQFDADIWNDGDGKDWKPVKAQIIQA